MNDIGRFQDLLRSGLPAAVPGEPSRDLWPLVVSRIEAPAEWSWIDMSLVAFVGLALLLFPEGLFLLAYHF